MAADQPIVAASAGVKKAWPQPLLVALNIFSLSFAGLFSIVTVFGAIAKLTQGTKSGGWLFNWGNNVVPISVGATLSGAIATLLFALVAFLTIRKITDANALKKAYGIAAVIFAIFTIGFVAELVAIIFGSLFALGLDTKGIQKGFWLHQFLPTLIVAGATFGLTYVYKAVNAGKTAILSILHTLVLVVASVGLLLVVIQTLVSYYGESKSSGYSTGYSDLYDYLEDYK